MIEGVYALLSFHSCTTRTDTVSGFSEQIKVRDFPLCCYHSSIMGFGTYWNWLCGSSIDWWSTCSFLCSTRCWDARQTRCHQSRIYLRLQFLTTRDSANLVNRFWKRDSRKRDCWISRLHSQCAPLLSELLIRLKILSAVVSNKTNHNQFLLVEVYAQINELTSSDKSCASNFATQ